MFEEGAVAAVQGGEDRGWDAGLDDAQLTAATHGGWRNFHPSEAFLLQTAIFAPPDW